MATIHMQPKTSILNKQNYNKHLPVMISLDSIKIVMKFNNFLSIHCQRLIPIVNLLSMFLKHFLIFSQLLRPLQQKGVCMYMTTGEILEAHCYIVNNYRLDLEPVRRFTQSQLTAGRLRHVGLCQLHTKLC